MDRQNEEMTEWGVAIILAGITVLIMLVLWQGRQPQDIKRNTDIPIKDEAFLSY